MHLCCVRTAALFAGFMQVIASLTGLHSIQHLLQTCPDVMNRTTQAPVLHMMHLQLAFAN